MKSSDFIIESKTGDGLAKIAKHLYMFAFHSSVLRKLEREGYDGISNTGAAVGLGIINTETYDWVLASIDYDSWGTLDIESNLDDAEDIFADTDLNMSIFDPLEELGDLTVEFNDAKQNKSNTTHGEAWYKIIKALGLDNKSGLNWKLLNWHLMHEINNENSRIKIKSYLKKKENSTPDIDAITAEEQAKTAELQALAQKYHGLLSGEEEEKTSDSELRSLSDIKDDIADVFKKFKKKYPSLDINDVDDIA